MSRPNLLVFLADDQGYGDVGCYGAADLETPTLDRLAAQGARCTQWYGGSPVCSASRASLLTGCLPHTAGVPGNVPASWEASGLAAEAPTLPELLREAGYQTYMSGKWHLGQAAGQRPHDRGFDDWFGFLHGCVDYYSHIFYWLMADGGSSPRHDLWHNDEELDRNGQYLTDLIADQAIAYLQRAKQDGRPFFLYVPFNAPHYPMHAPADVMARFAHLDEARQLTAAMLWTYDRAIERILDELDRLGLAEDTCVFASADHGPSRETRNWPDGRAEPYPGGSTQGLRGAKFSLFEGGIRVPAIWRWPSVVPAGSEVETPLHHHDLLPTFLAAAGIDLPPHVEGLDVRPALAGEAAPARECLQWAYAKQQAIRRGPWKLVRQADQPPMLFDLASDPAEQHDRSAEQPAVVAELVSILVQRRGTSYSQTS
ncbi:MAG: sulfatase-like hydrolase/transferase [Phycisphaeraceae bacterium]